jgi:hypothetical protein
MTTNTIWALLTLRCGLVVTGEREWRPRMPVLTGESLTAKFFSMCSTRSATQRKTPEMSQLFRAGELEVNTILILISPGFGYLKRQGSSYLFEPA